MKRIQDMPQNEILGLTEEDLDQLVLLEMAHKGIKIPEHPKKPEYIDVKKPEKRLYKCGALNFHCESMDVLNKFVELILEQNEHLYTCSRDWQTDSTYYEHGVETSGYSNKIAQETEVAYSQDEHRSVSEAIKANKKLKEQYTNDVKAYEDEKEAADDVRSEVMVHYYKAMNKKRRIERHVETFLRYYKIAEQNFDIAKNFFYAAYNVEDEDKEEVEARFVEAASTFDSENPKAED